jgi:hypothetical protein
MILVRNYNAGDKEAWDSFVNASKNGTFLFRRDYMEYHAERIADHSLMVFEGERLVALLPASHDADGMIVSHGGLTYGGLVTGNKMTAVLALDVFRSVLAHFRAEGFTAMLYKPVPHFYHRHPAEEDLQALFLCGAQICRSDLSSTVPLRNSLGFAKSKRAGVKAATKAGIEVIESWSFSDFSSMLAHNIAGRHGATPTHSQAELELLSGRFPKEIRLFEARRKGDICAGILMFDCGPTVHAQYISSTQEGRDMGAIDAIVSHLITETFDDRDWFDFGISTVNQGRELNVGLSRQKEMYGAKTTVYQQYLVPLSTFT